MECDGNFGGTPYVPVYVVLPVSLLAFGFFGLSPFRICNDVVFIHIMI